MSDQLDATLKSYLKQWGDYFGDASSTDEFLRRLKTFAFEGKLRSCKFRSVCWRIFLGCLPPEVSQWREAIEKSRKEYIRIKNLHVVKPTHEAEGKDLEVENPLSQNDQSMWLKYFKNSELKTMIERDVKRTFPEMEYFHNEKVHELLVNVLFCYAQEHKDLSYRQGMHELLAPLVFIIHCDLQASCHAREIGKLSDIIDTVLDTDYLEHDSYNMFCYLMESTNPWYSVTERGCEEVKQEQKEENGSVKNGNTFPTQPFQPQEVTPPSSGPTLAITNKLNHIHDTLLVKHDLQLHKHLNELEIIPQVFGLRWIRLLFGREFSLQDLLVLWDAIFADSRTLDLVDYLFIAMLIHIRQQLMSADYSTCMQILMRYPPVDDINDIVRDAKEIRTLKGSFSDTLIEAQRKPDQPPPRTVPVKPKKSPDAQAAQSINKTNSFTKLFKDITRKVIPDKQTSPLAINEPTFPDILPSHLRSSQVIPRQFKNGATVPKQKKLLNEAPKSEEMSRRNPTQLEEQVAVLHYELERMKQMCLYCSEKISASVNFLQANMNMNSYGACGDDVRQGVQDAIKDTSAEDQAQFERDQVLVTLAGLKQVRDLLQGSLTFNPNLREYIGKRSQTPEPPVAEPATTDQAVVNGHEGPESPQSIVNPGALGHEAPAS